MRYIIVRNDKKKNHDRNYVLKLLAVTKGKKNVSRSWLILLAPLESLLPCSSLAWNVSHLPLRHVRLTVPKRCCAVPQLLLRYCRTSEHYANTFFFSRVLRTPNLREQCRPREQLAPSLLAMEVQQTGVLDLLRYQHLQEATKRKLSLRVLLFSEHLMYIQNKIHHTITSWSEIQSFINKPSLSLPFWL